MVATRVSEPTLSDPKILDPDDPNLSPHRLRAVEALRLFADGVVRLVDVRKAPARTASGRCVAGASWRDPAGSSAGGLASVDGSPVAYYCVHGHEVSQSACEAGRSGGEVAYFVEGGFEALEAAGAEIGSISVQDEGER